MSQQFCTQAVVYMNVPVDICLKTRLCVTKDVYLRAFFIFRLLKINVYLSCNCLITVLHRRASLGYLYALHPWTGNISKRVRCRRTTVVGQVFSKHLHIRARKSQQLYLSRTCCCIGITDVHRGICTETLTKIAARSLEKFLLPYPYTIDGTAQTGCPGTACHHRNLADSAAFHLYCRVGRGTVACIFLSRSIHTNR